MKIPTAKELGGMLKATKPDFIESTCPICGKESMRVNRWLLDEMEVEALLKAIGLPEPDFTAEPLNVEEWERTYVTTIDGVEIELKPEVYYNDSRAYDTSVYINGKWYSAFNLKENKDVHYLLNMFVQKFKKRGY